MEGATRGSSATVRAPWPKKRPRKLRSDAGVQKGLAARPEFARPSTRQERLSKEPSSRKSARTDKRPRHEKVDERPACSPATQVHCDAASFGGRSSGQLALHARFAIGRTPQRLQHLSRMHLFHSPESFSEVPTMAPGVTAMLDEQLVFGVSNIFSRRRIPMVDVLLLQHREFIFSLAFLFHLGLFANGVVMCFCWLRNDIKKHSNSVSKLFTMKFKNLRNYPIRIPCTTDQCTSRSATALPRCE